MRRPFLGTAVLLCFAATASAQLVPPPGWTWHHDSRGASPDSAGWRFDMMPPGFHLTTTTTGVTLFPSGSVIGQRRAAEAKAILFPGTAGGPYGLVIVNLDNPKEWQGILLQRAGGVGHTVARSDQTLTMGSFAARAGVVVPDSTGFATNVLRVEIGSDSARFLANGVGIGAIARADLPKRAEVGFRMGEGLNMHVTIFDLITPLAPARP